MSSLATSAQLNSPFGVFVSSNNEVYIADYGNQRIRKILKNGNIVTIAGNGTAGFRGDNGPATNAQLYNPYSVFVSSNNEVYIADFSNHRIRKILENGKIVTIAGNGTGGFSGDNGPATNAQLNNPYSVFVSSNNEVYIVDYNNHRIRKILKNGNIVTIAGNGTGGFSGDNGPATNAQLNNPMGVFVSSNNEVYIADYYNHRIRKILENGNIVTIAGNGTAGFSGDSPFDIRTYPHIGNKLLTGNGNLHSKIEFHNLKKHSRDELFGLPIYGFIPLIEKTSPKFSNILKNEKILCLMSSSQQEIIQKLIDSLIYDKNKVKFNKEEMLDVLFILGLFKNGEFIDLKRSLTKNGNIVTIAGNGTAGFRGDNGPATNAQLYNPYSVFVSSNNEVYIVDYNNHRIRKILKNGNIVTIAGNGTGGFSGDNGPATNAQLNNPMVVIHLGPATNAQLNNPYSVFVSSNNEVYIVDYNNHRIRKILENGNIVTIAGNGTGGFSGDNGPATNAQLNNPMGVFVSSNNEVYIADYYNHRIRKILENGNIVTIAGNGTAGFSGDSPFDIRTYPHIGNKDELFGLPIYGFIPLIEKTSPKFSNILKNEKILCLMSSSQQEIIQKLIDSLIYDKNKVKFNKEEMLDVLFILGLFKNGEFIDLKRSLTSEFVNSLTLENLTFKWETIENLLKICKEEFNVQNYILDHLNNYCIEYAVVQMRTKEGNTVLPTLPIIMRNGVAIFSKMIITKPTAINIEETIEIKPQTIESLYNDKKTSDVKIKMGQNKYLYCHKTVLSSSSTLFNALFDSGSCFSDLSDDGIFTPDESEDLELLEIVIKHCYGISIDKIDAVKIIGLLDMAMKHEIQYLVDYCKNNFNLSIDNYFTILEACEKYLDLQPFEQFMRDIIKFSITNRKQLFKDRNRISNLPEKVWQEMVFKFSQDF
ncbi:predicted protein [Naegleria gruberi]|uniref:Predicted protein n=1 Tax=Naegleria gruberi TaxID=5762 RepID=D2V6D2_NAEGR|nr:uncharacterized protein NAEGRDRAFT_64395 [Naegleria gruberi]EFC47427.1 predicted protein [Naegleria gruberi]|eukprot:XP_002680171.1 predicted protein [Naegleria gruberi strain NEG-M]